MAVYCHIFKKYTMEEENPYRYKYWRPAVSADNVVFRFDGKRVLLLLIKRKNEPFKDCWALPGGFMEEGENLQQTALRELLEEAGVKPLYTHELCVCSDPNRDPRGQVVSAIFYSFVRSSECAASDDAADVRWFDLYELPDLAFDHAEIIEKALATMRLKIKFDPSFFFLLDELFTLPDLCRLWSAVFNRNFDRRNFQKHWTTFSLLTNIISPVEKAETKGKRTQRFYKYNEEAYKKFTKKHRFHF